MNRFVVCEMLFNASNEIPFVSAASPKIATTCSLDFRRSRPAAIPSAAESAVPAWAAP